jgi:ASC-1-like (ASCH) protein
MRFRVVDRDKFNEISTGKKSIETRAATIKYKKVKVGDRLTIICGSDQIVKEVVRIEHYRSIEDMFKKINYSKILPSVKSAKEAIRVFYSFPDYKIKIKQYGILAFYL